MKRLALSVRQPVHEQPIALLDAVLLATEGDDRVVGHGSETRASAREPRILAAIRLEVVDPLGHRHVLARLGAGRGLGLAAAAVTRRAAVRSGTCGLLAAVAAAA